MNKIKQVIVMRKDLKMRKGKMVAQGAHASLKVFFDKMEETEVCESLEDENGQSEFPGYVFTVSEAEQEWIKGKFTKICVSTDSEEELFEIKRKAEEVGLTVALIIDSGLTEFNGVLTPTCLAIGPDYADKIDPITSDLKLLW